jgi:riboflavin synthase
VFTGIVEERGMVRACGPGPSGPRLEVACRTVAEDAAPGASVAVNGVCLTVVDHTGEALAFDLGAETAARSTLGELRAGDAVNLERPVTLAARLGGHLVQGHVDGTGTVVARRDDGAGGSVFRIRAPSGFERYVVEKGSIAVDGVSLTVVAAKDDGFTVELIPHTLAVTTLGGRRPGDRVNVEVDVVAKYVERLVGSTG